MTTENPSAPLSTSDGARCYIAHFFAREMRRHDFATYIATELAADFACALAQHLAATGKQQVGEQQGDALPPLSADEVAAMAPAGLTWDETGAWAMGYEACRKAALAARQPGELIAQKVGDYRVTVAEDTITVSHGRDIVFAYSAGDAEPIMARQPGAQVPVADECSCDNGGVRYAGGGAACSTCGKRPSWYMGGRRIRVTERRKPWKHLGDPVPFEAECTWHMDDSIEYRRDGETTSRRLNCFRQHWEKVEVIR
jgi:hypothetical protein